MLTNKTVLIGVCGGIAAYKVMNVVSELKKLNAKIKIMMTRTATNFVSPLTFQTMSCNSVELDMFSAPENWNVRHVSLAKLADVVLVAPATANTIAKIAAGMADNILTATVLATNSPVIIAPAMNSGMYRNSITTSNMKKLHDIGFQFVHPEIGKLACGTNSVGRLASPSLIVDKIIETSLFERKDFFGRNVLVTAGATREYFDAVRFVSSPASGKMGFAIAKAAKMRGACVKVIAGKCELPPDVEFEIVNVNTANDMYNAVMSEADNYDTIIKAAAVSDFKFTKTYKNKMKKSKNLTLEMTENVDILKELGKKYGGKGKILVGFCMETDNLLESAANKLRDKNLDCIVANNLCQKGAGFATDSNIVTIIMKDGSSESFEIMSKFQVANLILDRIR